MPGYHNDEEHVVLEVSGHYVFPMTPGALLPLCRHVLFGRNHCGVRKPSINGILKTAQASTYRQSVLRRESAAVPFSWLVFVKAHLVRFRCQKKLEAKDVLESTLQGRIYA